MRKQLSVALVFVLVFLISHLSAAPAPRTLFVADIGDMAPIDPATYTSTRTRTFIRNVYEPLVYYELGAYSLEPRLATSWERSADGLVYTLKLRRGVKFHNGEPFTAEDVKVTFDRVAAIGQNVAPASLGGSVKSVVVADPYTVKFTLNFPYGYFMDVLPKVPIVSAQDVKTRQVNGDWAREWFLNNANGTGPYKLASWERGVTWTVVRNTDWWGKLPSRAYDRVVMRVINDGAQQRQLLARGEIDLVSDWIGNLDKINATKESTKVKLLNTKGLLQLLLVMHAGKVPTDDKLVRQAMIAAFPYEKFMGYYKGHAEQPRSVFRAAYPGTLPNLPPLKQDLDLARSLLAKAGYPNGGFTLEYNYDQGAEEKKQAALLFQNALAQIGVQLNIVALPGAAWFGKGANPQTSAHFNPHYEAPETPDPFQWILKMFGAKGYLNWTHSSRPRLDAIILEAQHSLDPQRRVRLLQEAQRLIGDEALAIPMSSFDSLHVMSNCLEGYIYDQLDLQNVPKFWTLHRSSKCP